MAPIDILARALKENPFEITAWFALADACEEEGSFAEMARLLQWVGKMLQKEYENLAVCYRTCDMHDRNVSSITINYQEQRFQVARAYSDHAFVFLQIAQRMAGHYGKAVYLRRLEKVRLAVEASQRIVKRGQKRGTLYGVSLLPHRLERLRQAMEGQHLVENRWEKRRSADRRKRNDNRLS